MNETGCVSRETCFCCSNIYIGCDQRQGKDADADDGEGSADDNTATKCSDGGDGYCSDDFIVNSDEDYENPMVLVDICIRKQFMVH